MTKRGMRDVPFLYQYRVVVVLAEWESFHELQNPPGIEAVTAVEDGAAQCSLACRQQRKCRGQTSNKGSKHKLPPGRTLLLQRRRLSLANLKVEGAQLKH